MCRHHPPILKRLRQPKPSYRGLVLILQFWRLHRKCRRRFFMDLEFRIPCFAGYRYAFTMSVGETEIPSAAYPDGLSLLAFYRQLAEYIMLQSSSPPETCTIGREGPVGSMDIEERL